MTVSEFCYWLQGYFEIADHVTLTNEQIAKILSALHDLNQPLDGYTLWLKDTLVLMQKMIHNQHYIDFMLPLIKNELNNLFLHVIDNSYETKLSSKQLYDIHQGKIKLDNMS